MDAKLNVAFGIILAHLTPGGMLLTSILLWQGTTEPLKSCVTALEGDKFVEGGAFLLASLTLGLLLDAFRYIVTFVICLIPLVSSKHQLTPTTSESDIKVYEWIMENRFRFHQFYGNSALAAVIALVLGYGQLTSLLWYILLVVVIVFFAASCIAFYHSMRDLKNKFPSP